jgi:cytochrome c
MNYGGRKMMIAPTTAGWFNIKQIDLTQITGATVSLGWQKPAQYGYTFELRLDAPDGQQIGMFTLPTGGEDPAVTKKQFAAKDISFAIQPVNDGKKHNLYIVSKPLNTAEANQVILTGIEFR